MSRPTPSIAPGRALVTGLLALAAACGGGGGDSALTPGATVQVLLQRDVYGVAHIESASDAGAYFGAGYAAAEDRFYQMCLSRLFYRGRLAEVLGAGEGGLYVDRDRQARLFGWRRHGERVLEHLKAEEPEMHTLLVAYAAGVNRYLKDVAADPTRSLHPYFAGLPDVIAPIAPEPWTPVDSLGVWMRLGTFFQNFGEAEVDVRREIDQKLAAGMTEAEILAELNQYAVVDDHAAVVKREDVPDELLLAMEQFALQYGVQSHGANHTLGPQGHFSHAWAATGDRTATGPGPGGALLLGDPRIPLTAPNELYEWHMRGASFDVRGAGVPGSPNLLVGSSSQVAWSVTSLAADQADLFRLTVDESTTPWRYFVDGEWLTMEEDPEEVLVWSFVDEESSPAVFEEPLFFRRTAFGPLITPWLGLFEEDEYALSAVPFELPDSADETAFLKMYRSADAGQFRTALAGWAFPSVNVVFAGSGSASDPSAPDLVGYVANGAHPVRAPHFLAGLMYLDGDSLSKRWQTFVPHDFKPWVLKNGVDDDGVVYSANHLPAGTWYPLPRLFPSLGDTDRSRRIRERLGSSPTFEPNDFADMHADRVRPSARDLARLVDMAAETGMVFSSDAAAALPVLLGWWKGGAALDGAAPGTALASFLTTGLFLDKPTHLPMATMHGRGAAGLAAYLKAKVAQLESPAPAPLTSADLEFLDDVLAEAYQAVTGEEGAGTADPASWDSWYAAAKLENTLPVWKLLGGVDLLMPNLTHGPLFAVDTETLASQSAQAYTQLVPIGVTDGARSLLPPGQAEPGSGAPFEASQVALWAAGALRPSPTSVPGIVDVGLYGPLKVLEY